ncbi:MAG: hypothetical protein J0J01_31260 [Reyranella sp.]|uniref:hypothetical protein n=1 Tax=Reyranella sp. TaxID=1929291 RepID=UPI001ACCDC8F|nr:hypothetical protein [Reyranella sp.]MBN9091420.1 hypothetical protein [Reyranella sp.]
MNPILRACALALGLSGCSLMGPSYLVNPNGLSRGVAGGTDGTVYVFGRAFKDSRDDHLNITKAADMVKVGVELEYQLCADFFRTGGKDQQWLLFGKDFLAVAGTLTTGILGAVGAATGGANASAIAWTGLAAAGGVSFINLYARNFLFSEDNIQAVQDLTLKAVDAARREALSDARLATYSFATAITALTDVQSQCEVQNILVLVRKSLNLARPYSVPDIGTATTQSVQASLGGWINGGVPVTDAELQALYWLFRFRPEPTAQQKTEIYNQLGALFIPPLKNNGENPEFFNKAYNLRSILGALPLATAQEIETRIQAVVTASAGSRQGGPVPPSFVRQTFGPLPPAKNTVTTFGRISVDIR